MTKMAPATTQMTQEMTLATTQMTLATTQMTQEMSHARKQPLKWKVETIQITVAITCKGNYFVSPVLPGNVTTTVTS